MQTRRSFALTVVFLVASVALAFADADPKKQLLGKWKPDEKGIVIEFQAAGKLVITIDQGGGDKPATLNGTYKWVDKDSLDITVSMGKDPTTERVKVAFSGDTLTTTDSKGKADKFTRVK